MIGSLTRWTGSLYWGLVFAGVSLVAAAVLEIASPMFSTVVLTVILAAALDGRVVEDHSGNPVASVEVRVLRNGAPGVVAELETDGDGHFKRRTFHPATTVWSFPERTTWASRSRHMPIPSCKFGCFAME